MPNATTPSIATIRARMVELASRHALEFPRLAADDIAGSGECSADPPCGNAPPAAHLETTALASSGQTPSAPPATVVEQQSGKALSDAEILVLDALTVCARHPMATARRRPDEAERARKRAQREAEMDRRIEEAERLRAEWRGQVARAKAGLCAMPLADARPVPSSPYDLMEMAR